MPRISKKSKVAKKAFAKAPKKMVAGKKAIAFGKKVLKYKK